MKIGIVCYPSVGGSGIVATRLGIELAKLGHQVHFVSYDKPFEFKDGRNIHFHKVELVGYQLFPYPDYTLPLATKMVEVQKVHSLDILHVHYAVPHATAALLACSIMEQDGVAKPAVVTTLHGTDISLMARDKSLFAAIRYSILNSDAVTAVSRSLRADTLELIEGAKIVAIHNFYSPAKVTANRSHVRQSLGFAEDDFVAIHMSNLRPVKRISDLLEIAKISALRIPKFKLLILAGDDFGPYMPLADELGNSLVVVRDATGIGNYISASDVGIYTSQHESFGMGVLETMAYGRPVLATRVGGTPEVVDNQSTGFLLEVGNVEGFYNRILQLTEDPDLAARMGAEGAKVAKKRFGAKAIVGQYLRLYRGLLKNK